MVQNRIDVMIAYNTLVVLCGVSILGASAGLVGTFAVLRRRALTGDALGHAALPGICLAFLITGERRLPVLLLGAFLSGLAGVMVIAALRRYTRIKEDASVGVVLSVFFGAGLALSSFIQQTVPGGSKAGLDSFILGDTATMILQDVYLIAGCSVVCLAVVLLLYKECKLVAFDSGFARVQGWPAGLLDLLLMALLAVTVMIGLPAVGAVLMAALLILPGATARLWTHRLSRVLLLAAALGATTGLIGTALSANLENTPAGPLIILVGAAFFLASLLLSPRHGLLASWIARRRFARELEQRRLLRQVFDLVEPTLPRRVAIPEENLLFGRTWKPERVRALLEDAVRDGHLERNDRGQYLLTDCGLERAAAVARGYRLWTLFLTEHAEVATGMANLAEESIDGLVPEEQVAALERQLQRQGRLPVSNASFPPRPRFGGEGLGVRGLLLEPKHPLTPNPSPPQSRGRGEEE